MCRKYLKDKSLVASGYWLNTKKGFTLLEFLIYISIISVVSLLIGGSFLSLNSGRALNDSRAEVNSAINTVMGKIKDDLKNASKVTNPHVGGLESALTLTINGEEVRYTLDASGLVKRGVGSAQPAVLNSDKVIFTVFNFEHIQNTNISLARSLVNVRANMTVEYNTDNPSKEYSETARAVFSLGKLVNIVRPDGSSVSASGIDYAGDNIPKSP